MNQATPKQTIKQAPVKPHWKTNKSDEVGPQQVLVFKTNILLPAMAIFVRPILDATEGIVQWNIDYADCDHVLRVVTTGPDTRAIEEIIRQAGFNCEELTD